MKKKKQKPLLHEFNIGVYPRKLWVAISKDTFKDELSNIPEFNDDYYALTMETSNKKTGNAGVLIRFGSIKDATCKNICHESTHAALSIFHTVGAKVDYDNSEPFAYLVDFIAGCCEEVRKNKRRTK